MSFATFSFFSDRMWHDVLELEIDAGVKSQGGGRRKENPTEPSVMREKDLREEWEASATGKARKESLYLLSNAPKGSRLGYLRKNMWI